MAKKKTTGETISELWDLVTAYAKQELVDPLKTLPGYLGRGVAGAVLTAMGFLFLLIGILRLLQYEARNSLSANFSGVPYLVVFVVGAFFMGVLASRISKGFDEDQQ